MFLSGCGGRGSLSFRTYSEFSCSRLLSLPKVVLQKTAVLTVWTCLSRNGIDLAFVNSMKKRTNTLIIQKPEDRLICLSLLFCLMFLNVTGVNCIAAQEKKDNRAQIVSADREGAERQSREVALTDFQFIIRTLKMGGTQCHM